MIRAAIVGLGWWGRNLVDAVQHSEAIRFVSAHTRTASTVVDFCRERDLGWTGDPKHCVFTTDLTPPHDDTRRADASAKSDQASQDEWQTIAFHSARVAQAATAISSVFAPGDVLVRLLQVAARWHDIGKAHRLLRFRVRDHRILDGEFAGRRAHRGRGGFRQRHASRGPGAADHCIAGGGRGPSAMKADAPAVGCICIKPAI